MAITWRNVDFGGGNQSMNQIAAATAPLSLLNDSISKGLTSLTNTLDKYKEGQINANNEAYQNTLAQYKTPEEFEAAMKAGIFDTARQGYGSWLDGKVARDSVGDYLSKLQQQQKENWAYQNADLAQRTAPVAERIQQMYASGDIQGAKALAAQNTDLSLGKTLENMVLWGEGRDTALRAAKKDNLDIEEGRFDLDNKKRVESERVLKATADQHAALGETNAIMLLQKAHPNVDFSGALTNSRTVTNYDKELKEAERKTKEDAVLASIMGGINSWTTQFNRHNEQADYIANHGDMRHLLKDGRVLSNEEIQKDPELVKILGNLSDEDLSVLQSYTQNQNRVIEPEAFHKSISEALAHNSAVTPSIANEFINKGTINGTNPFQPFIDQANSLYESRNKEFSDSSSTYWGGSNRGEKLTNLGKQLETLIPDADRRQTAIDWAGEVLSKEIDVGDYKINPDDLPLAYILNAVLDQGGTYVTSRNRFNDKLKQILSDPATRNELHKAMQYKTANDELKRTEATNLIKKAIKLPEPRQIIDIAPADIAAEAAKQKSNAAQKESPQIFKYGVLGGLLY